MSLGRRAIPTLVSVFVLGTSTHAQSTSEVTGTIAATFSAAIAGASLTLSSLDRAFQTKSGLDGRFRFENVPKGKYELEASANGFLSQTLLLELSTSVRVVGIVLRVGPMPDPNYCGPHPSITYGSQELQATHVDGVIRDYGNRKPVRKAEVSLWGAGEDKPAFTFDFRPQRQIRVFWHSGEPLCFAGIRSWISIWRFEGIPSTTGNQRLC
ncbi:MAG: carboxypeptidase regulatory-like domain-containing protein [Acidobacteriaceae bacterium]|nr:carboxypeptidase regulatory-like domain-containing protein [Acidobacteriaceae bacterium]